MANLLTSRHAYSLYVYNKQQLLIGNSLYTQICHLHDKVALQVRGPTSRPEYFCWEDTSLIFELMFYTAPSTDFVTRRVRKTIFKSTRGKSGRYTTTFKYIPENRRFSHQLREYKRIFKFSSKLKFSDKLLEVLSVILHQSNSRVSTTLDHKPKSK